jgi:L-ascorbate metabolism protein UlaG (beta-lactamase superfamily)
LPIELTYCVSERSWFRIRDGGNVVHIDPGHMRKDVLPTKSGEKADLILVSHSHFDHLKHDLVEELTGPGTRIIAAPKAAKSIGVKAEAIVPGGHTEYKGIVLRAVHAYNPRGSGLITYHKKGQGVGFIIEWSGRRLYHAGDTGLIPEMKDFGPIDIAMLPIGGTYTMDVDEAAEAVRWIQPKVTIPMHNLKTDPSVLAEKVGSEHRVVVLKAGEKFTLE